ncbi:MAG: hypothetical protein ACU0B7_09845 [Paracoccaceae bacterium]
MAAVLAVIALTGAGADAAFCVKDSKFCAQNADFFLPVLLAKRRSFASALFYMEIH